MIEVDIVLKYYCGLWFGLAYFSQNTIKFMTYNIVTPFNMHVDM